MFSSSSSTHRHTPTRSCSNIYSRLWGLSVPTFRIFEDFRGFWLGTSNIYPRCPAKNILDFPMKIFFFKKSKIGHGGCTQNWIPSTTTVTEFSKTFPVFYKWPDLTDVHRGYAYWYCTFDCSKIVDVGTLSFRWILPFWYFCFLLEDKASLALSSKTSEREGKLSNPRARAARAMQGENLRKFTDTRARSPRARHALILPWPTIQYHGI